MLKLSDSIDYVFSNEIIGYDPNDEANGGKINFTETPGDHGGATKWGVSQQVWNEYFNSTVSASVIEQTNKYDAMSATFKYFWSPCSLAQINYQNLATACLDLIFSNGSKGAMLIQQAVINLLGKNIALDGEFGPITIGSINACDPKALIVKISQLSQARYQQIVNNYPSQQKFLNGWTDRAQKLMSLV